MKLRKISERVKGHSNYFSHHSSVDKEVREYVEYFAKNTQRQNFCISCTSTLELGIDIGTVDEVVQIDATHSIASLIQRVGRSGRKEGMESKLFLYATGSWSLLQSLACWLLYKEKFIEPPEVNEMPYDILLHQALSITKGHSGIDKNVLIQQLKNNAAFRTIDIKEIEEIIGHLIRIDFLEQLQQELIIGVEGEKVVNSRDFYSFFKAEENFKVEIAGNTIGEVPFSPQIVEGENILLAAKIWKIVHIDDKAKKVEVIKAADGKRPMFFGSGAAIHSRIREKMFAVLYSNESYPFLDENSSEEIRIMRNDFSEFKINDLKTDRPLWSKEKTLEFYTYTGTKVNRAIQFLFNLAAIENFLDDSSSTIEIKIPKQEFLAKWDLSTKSLNNIDVHIGELLQANSALLDFSKWGQYLPVHYQIKLLKEKYYDFKGAEELLFSCRLVENLT